MTSTISINGRDYKIQQEVADLIEAQRQERNQLEAQLQQEQSELADYKAGTEGMRESISDLRKEVIVMRGMLHKHGYEDIQIQSQIDAFSKRKRG